MVRGWLVRKQAAVTLRRLQALVWLGSRQAAQKRTKIHSSEEPQVFPPFLQIRITDFCISTRSDSWLLRTEGLGGVLILGVSILSGPEIETQIQL